MSEYFDTPIGSLQPPPSGSPSTPQAAGTAPSATASFILSIIGLLFFPFAFIAFFLALRAKKAIKASGGTLSGGGRATVGLILGFLGSLIGVFSIFALYKAATDPEWGNTDRGPGVEEFQNATSDLRRAPDNAGLGNNDKARQAAKHLSSLISSYLREYSEGVGDVGPVEVYAQLNPNSAAFIVRIDQLKEYDEESKDVLAESVAELAAGVASSFSFPAGSEFSVSVRGRFIYHSHSLGEINVDKTAHITKSYVDETSIYPFFAPALPVAEDSSVLPETEEPTLNEIPNSSLTQ